MTWFLIIEKWFYTKNKQDPYVELMYRIGGDLDSYWYIDSRSRPNISCMCRPGSICTRKGKVYFRCHYKSPQNLRHTTFKVSVVTGPRDLKGHLLSMECLGLWVESVLYIKNKFGDFNRQVNNDVRLDEIELCILLNSQVLSNRVDNFQLNGIFIRR